MKPVARVAIVLLLWSCPVLAATTQPSIAISTDVEDNKKMLQALVSVDGKPIENVTLQYFVRRTFGDLQIGEDKTLDDGTSAVAFPSDLTAGPDGNLDVIVRVKAPSPYAPASSTATFTPDTKSQPIAEVFPRALWAPNAPVSLMACIFIVLAGVWFSYVFVVTRILAIRTGGKP